MKKAKYPKPSRYHNIREMIESTVKERGRAPAFYQKLNGKYQAFSYSRLKNNIKALGVSLMRRGLGGKKFILIEESSYPFSLAYITALCGLGTVIPVSKNISDAELASIAKITSAAAIIYPKSLENKTASVPKKLQKIDFDEILLLCDMGLSFSDRELGEFDKTSIDIDATAIISFARAKDGFKRGIMLSQRNICSALGGLTLALPCEKGSATLAILPPHSVFETVTGILYPLSQGCTVCFCDDTKQILPTAKDLNPSSIVCSAGFIEKLYSKIQYNIRKREINKKVSDLIKVTDAIKIPSLRIKAKRKVFADIHKAFGENMTDLTVAGISADSEAVTGLRALGFNVTCVYGITECASVIALTDSKGDLRVIPSGEVKISEKDKSGTGKLCYRGDNVMIGYYKEENLNRSIKINGWIDTEDIGRIDDDGVLDVLKKQ